MLLQYSRLSDVYFADAECCDVTYDEHASKLCILKNITNIVHLNV